MEIGFRLFQKSSGGDAMDCGMPVSSLPFSKECPEVPLLKEVWKEASKLLSYLPLPCFSYLNMAIMRYIRVSQKELEHFCTNLMYSDSFFLFIYTTFISMVQSWHGGGNCSELGFTGKEHTSTEPNPQLACVMCCIHLFSVCLNRKLTKWDRILLSHITTHVKENGSW